MSVVKIVTVTGGTIFVGIKGKGSRSKGEKRAKGKVSPEQIERMRQIKK